MVAALHLNHLTKSYYMHNMSMNAYKSVIILHIAMYEDL